jgi:hypothetical protein
MRVTFKITRRLFRAVQVDLLRPHAFAAERVGWLRCRVGNDVQGGAIVVAHDYYPVDDQDYVDDPRVGAMMGSVAIRKALQIALNENVSMFHVHMHDHSGRPGFSGTDARESAKFVPDFWHVRPAMPHGALVFSRDAVYGRCWYPGGNIVEIGQTIIVGAPLVRIREENGTTRSAKLSRKE